MILSGFGLGKTKDSPEYNGLHQGLTENNGSKSEIYQSKTNFFDIDTDFVSKDIKDVQKFNSEEFSSKVKDEKNRENKDEPEENHEKEFNNIAQVQHNLQQNSEEHITSPKIDENHETSLPKSDKEGQNSEKFEEKHNKSELDEDKNKVNEDKPKFTETIPKLNEDKLKLVEEKPKLAEENTKLAEENLKLNEQNILLNEEKTHSNEKEAITVGEIKEEKSNNKNTVKKEKIKNCPEGHILIKLYDILQKTQHEVQYANNIFDCSICEKQSIPTSIGVYHCDICPYDVCSSCNQIQKNENNEKGKEIETVSKENHDEGTCLNGHKLIKLLDILSITKHQNSYPDNHFRCGKCKIRRDSTKYESNHCDDCIYDLCSHCLKGHEFLLTHDLAINTEDPRYYENTYDCNVCMIDYECTQKEGAYHCERCSYDVCPNCFKDLYSE